MMLREHELARFLGKNYITVKLWRLQGVITPHQRKGKGKGLRYQYEFEDVKRQLQAVGKWPVDK